MAQTVLLADLARQHGDKALLQLLRHIDAMLLTQSADVVEAHHHRADFAVVAHRVRHRLHRLQFDVFSGKQPGFRILDVLLEVLLELVLRLHELELRVDPSQQFGAARTPIDEV